MSLVAVIALILSGCGIEDPYADDTANSATGGAEVQPSEPAATGDGPGPVLEQAALAYGNWTAETLDRSLRQTAALSVGPARSALLEEAQDLEAGIGRAPAGSRSRTKVEAIMLPEPSENRAIIVTREAVSGNRVVGEGYRYRVTLATVQQVGDRWAISSWEPQL